MWTLPRSARDIKRISKRMERLGAPTGAMGISQQLSTGRVMGTQPVGDRTRDVQLGKTTVNWKQRTLRFLHLVLAIENTQFSLFASYNTLFLSYARADVFQADDQSQRAKSLSRAHFA
jgi:hypothetical protein